MNTEKFNTLVNQAVIPVLLLITTSLGVVNTFTTIVLGKKSEIIQSKLDSLKVVQLESDMLYKDAEFIRELKFRLYDEVKTAIRNKDTNLQEITYEFVTQMMKDDEEFRNALLKTLKNSINTSTELKNTIEQNLKYENMYKLQQQEALEELKNEKEDARMFVDVFYLEENIHETYSLAQDITEKLKHTYRARLRVLSKLTNAQAVYQINNNEIRFEYPEQNEAKQIINSLDKDFNISIQQHPIFPKHKTPNYISLFIAKK